MYKSCSELNYNKAKIFKCPTVKLRPVKTRYYTGIKIDRLARKEDESDE